MIEWMKKIGQAGLLLVISLALIGVNVRQLYCCHGHNLHWELCLVPDEEVAGLCEEGVCEKGCCGDSSCSCSDSSCGDSDSSCHHTTRYDFYKITESAQVESAPDLSLVAVELPKEWGNDLLVEQLIVSEYRFLEEEWPDRAFRRPLLCTYLC